MTGGKVGCVLMRHADHRLK